MCCKNRCLLRNLQGDMEKLLKQWRRAWASLTYQERRDTLMEHVRRNITVDKRAEVLDGPMTERPKHKLKYTFCGCLWCKMSWHMATGIGVGCLMDTVKRMVSMMSSTSAATTRESHGSWTTCTGLC